MKTQNLKEVSPMKRVASSCVVAWVVAAAGVAVGVLAPEALGRQAVDAQSGRDLLSYPRHPGVDYTAMKLHVLIPDMNTRRMEIVQELTFTPLTGETESVRLDAKLMKIHSVKSSAGPATFTHEDGILTVSFENPVHAGDSCTITTAYTVTGTPMGMNWTPASDAWPGRPAQLHSKGEPEQNSYWFPCHDFPNDRMTTEIDATIPAAYEAVSNGKLMSVKNKALSVREAGKETSEDSRLGMYRTFHWVQDTPHVPYLVTLAVGRWDVVDVGTKLLPMPVYAPLGRGGDVKANFGRTSEMIDVFSKAFDEPYPWAKYAQVLVHNYSSGATENTSATTMHDGVIQPPDGIADTNPEGLLAHELVHQWFGDLVTCRSWEHIWINEAWATYAEALWFAHRDGPEGYDAHVFREFLSALASDTGSAPESAGMVSKQFRTPRDVFTKSASPYAKGASVLHMLRRRLGDDAFFKGTALFLDRFKFNQAETSDLQAAFEDVSGESLDQFFAQWCERPGHPVVDITLAWDAEHSTLTAKAVQKQKIDGLNPAFEFDIPLSATMQDGTTKEGTLEVRGRVAEMTIPLGAAPEFVSVDPRQNVLASWKIDAPRAWLRRQVQKGPTIASRAQAISSLAALADEKASGLCEILVFTPDQHELVKLEAIKALQRLRDASTLETCVLGRPPSPGVREAAASALAEVAGRKKGPAGDRGKERAAEMLARLYDLDTSPKVKAACIRGLGVLKAETYQPLVIAAAGVASPNDRIRQAAIRALADFGAPEALPIVLAGADESAPDRTRPVAFDALVKLRDHDADAVYEKISAAVISSPDRTRRSAGRALVNLQDPRGVELLEKLSEASLDRTERELLDGWRKELQEKIRKAAPAPDSSGSAKPAGAESSGSATGGEEPKQPEAKPAESGG